MRNRTAQAFRLEPRQAFAKTPGNVIGRRIWILRDGAREPAEALDIDEQGGLVVRTGAGVETLRSGEVSIRLEEAK